MASNTPFLEFKTTGDDKHGLETYIKDLTDYCIMQNWFDPSKETDAQKWTKPDKAMACLRASLLISRSKKGLQIQLEPRRSQSKRNLIVLSSRLENIMALALECQGKCKSFFTCCKTKRSPPLGDAITQTSSTV